MTTSSSKFFYSLENQPVILQKTRIPSRHSICMFLPESKGCTADSLARGLSMGARDDGCTSRRWGSGTTFCHAFTFQDCGGEDEKWKLQYVYKTFHCSLVLTSATCQIEIDVLDLDLHQFLKSMCFPPNNKRALLAISTCSFLSSLAHVCQHTRAFLVSKREMERFLEAVLRWARNEESLPWPSIWCTLLSEKIWGVLEKNIFLLRRDGTSFNLPARPRMAIPSPGGQSAATVLWNPSCDMGENVFSPSNPMLTIPLCYCLHVVT